MTPSATLPAQPDAELRWPALLGSDPRLRRQVWGVLVSIATYVLYSAIVVVQVWNGLMPVDAAVALGLVALVSNLAFLVLVRGGHVLRGRDPGLAQTQLVVGIAFLFAGYALVGPASGGLTLVMASHVVYAMFWMKPRQVWTLVVLLLAGLAGTMIACASLWPQRYPVPVQVSNFLYALLVLPLIAMLADRVTSLTQRLTQQQQQLQSALAQLQDLATRDELTRTHNRRHLTQLMHTQHALHRRIGAPLTLVLIDIDHFKQVNDRHGHAVGDEVLKGFAELAQKSLRVHDLLGRWGGEEFLVVLPHTGVEEARAAMQRLLSDLATPPEGLLPPGLAVSFSAGITLLAPGDTLQAALERADQAMYRAKTLGRARCELG